ncbi:MAG: hypothetical protein ATN35_06470 [Epulopiscium sp. Nele67-Bin004]|nr:MAG: hypothetical protein ATN35_06470 [Epulopiscium sp. Nele67-Bin004]
MKNREREKEKLRQEFYTLVLLWEYKEKNETLANFAKLLQARIPNKLTVKKYIDIEDVHSTEGLLIGMLHVLENTEEKYIRQLSLEVFKNPKQLEKIATKIKNIIREFHCEPLMSTEDVLGEFNVITDVEEIKIKGCREDEVKSIVVVQTSEALHFYEKPNTLIVFLGGHYNPARIEVLKQLQQQYPDAQWLYWGNIEYRSFQIYKELCIKTDIQFETMHMGVTTLNKYKEDGVSLTKVETGKLHNSLKDDNEPFKDVIALMLDEGIKLEQEIVALNMYTNGE